MVQQRKRFRKLLTDGNAGIFVDNLAYKYFDDWVIAGKSDDLPTFKVRKKGISHIETIEW